MNPRRTASASLVVGWVAASLVAGCGSRGGPAGPGAPGDSSFAATTGSLGRTPVALSRADGKAIYERYCLICHGESGDGDGFNAYNVKSTFGVSPTAFSDSAAMAVLADSVALLAIRGGGGAVGKSPAMPPWGRTLTRGEQADVWRYARSLASGSGDR